MNANPAMAGQKAAQEQSYVGWLLLGTVFGFMGPFFAHVLTPTAPSTVLQAGPKDPAEQHVFMDAYVGRAKNLRIRQAWIGLVFSFFLYTAACVGGCLTFMETTLDYMLRNPPSGALRNSPGQSGARSGDGAGRPPLVLRQPGEPGPRPTGVWTGSGGSNSPEETAGWRDSRVPESWTVEIAFGNDRIEISYPSLGCSGELEPRNESARWLEYTQDLMCTDPRYRTPFSRRGYLVLQRTADDMLWFEWSRGGRALATASLRPSSP